LPEPATLFYDYSGLTTAAHEQNMEITTTLRWGADLKVPLNPENGEPNEESKIPAPNFDGLAQEGMSFMDAHVPGAVCHPSRYGLLTGRYPFRTDTGVWPDEPVIEERRLHPY
jgi:hypothetical protein